MKRGPQKNTRKLLADPRVFFVVSVLFLVFTYLVWSDTYGIARVIEASGGLNVLDVSGSFTEQEAYTHIALMGKEGREAYMAFHAGIDMIYPASYALFGLSLLAMCCQRMIAQHPKTGWLLLAPVISALCDYLENYFIFQMLTTFPSQDTSYAMLANFFHLGKPLWGFVGLAALMAGIGFQLKSLWETKK